MNDDRIDGTFNMKTLSDFQSITLT